MISYFTLFVSHEAWNVFRCYVILILIFFLGIAIRYMTKANLWLFIELYMLHNTLQLQHPIFLLYLALFPVFSISRLSPYCFDLFRGLLGSFSSTSLIFCYYNCIVPNNYVALMFYNNIVSQASYMHLKLLPTCDVYFLDIRAPRFWGVPSSNFG